jgi:hypothetical protein
MPVPAPPAPTVDALVGRLLVLWAGLAIGVAFVATPAKFLAPSLSLPVALDVGRRTFAVYNRLELALLLGLVLVVVLARRPRWLPALALPGLVVVLQAVWLIPALDARVGVILAGQSPPPSTLHGVYIAAEALKVVALLLFGLAGPRRLHARGRSDAGAGQTPVTPP